MKILDATWFTTGASCIGLVKCEVEGGIKYFIGVGDGRDETQDTEHIMNFGAPVYPEHINRFLGGR